MKLVTGESISYKSRDGSLVVTNLRIMKTVEKGAQSMMTQIPLPHLSGVRMVHIDPKALLVLAGLVALGAAGGTAISKSYAPLIGGGVLALLFVALYFWLRRQVLEFMSDGGMSVRHGTKAGLKACQELMTFIEDVRHHYPNGPSSSEEVAPITAITSLTDLQKATERFGKKAA